MSRSEKMRALGHRAAMESRSRRSKTAATVRRVFRRLVRRLMRDAVPADVVEEARLRLDPQSPVRELAQAAPVAKCSRLLARARSAGRERRRGETVADRYEARMRRVLKWQGPAARGKGPARRRSAEFPPMSALVRELVRELVRQSARVRVLKKWSARKPARSGEAARSPGAGSG